MLPPPHLLFYGRHRGMLGWVCNSVFLKANMNRTCPALYASLIIYLFFYIYSNTRVAVGQEPLKGTEWELMITLSAIYGTFTNRSLHHNSAEIYTRKYICCNRYFLFLRTRPNKYCYIIWDIGLKLYITVNLALLLCKHREECKD